MFLVAMIGFVIVSTGFELCTMCLDYMCISVELSFDCFLVDDSRKSSKSSSIGVSPIDCLTIGVYTGS